MALTQRFQVVPHFRGLFLHFVACQVCAKVKHDRRIRSMGKS